MTVAELIALLDALPKDMRVMVSRSGLCNEPAIEKHTVIKGAMDWHVVDDGLDESGTPVVVIS